MKAGLLAGRQPVAAGLPFDLQFDHLWFAEGPEFTAAYSLLDAVTSWPDEVGTLDATRETGSGTTYETGAALGHPYVNFAGGRMRTGVPPVAFTVPYSVVVLGYIDDAAGYITDGRDASPRLVIGSGSAKWVLIQSLSSGAYALGKHGWYIVVKSGNDLGVVDGSTQVSSSNHDTAFDGLTFGAAYDNGAPLGDGRIALIGVYNGDVTADGDWAAFKTWASSYYGITL